MENNGKKKLNLNIWTTQYLGEAADAFLGSFMVFSGCWERLSLQTKHVSTMWSCKGYLDWEYCGIDEAMLRCWYIFGTAMVWIFW